MTINNIDTNTREGKLLMSALAILTTSASVRIDGKDVDGRKTNPTQMLNHLADNATWLYGDYFVDSKQS